MWHTSSKISKIWIWFIFVVSAASAYFCSSKKNCFRHSSYWLSNCLKPQKNKKKTFINYKMREQLKNFYVKQRNVKKFFWLHFKVKELTEALKALNDVIYRDFDDFLMQMIQRIYDYCLLTSLFAGKIKIATFSILFISFHQILKKLWFKKFQNKLSFITLSRREENFWCQKNLSA